MDAGYAVRPSFLPPYRPSFLPPYRGVRYHHREYGVRSPENPIEIYNLRHSSLRVTIESGIGSLKGRFRILDNKPHHPYKTQVKLVLACCILHNWIITFGHDDMIPNPEDWEPNPINHHGPGDNAEDNAAWVAQRDEWAQ